MKPMLTALALFAATPALAQDKLTIVLDWFVNPDHGPIVIDSNCASVTRFWSKNTHRFQLQRH